MSWVSILEDSIKRLDSDLHHLTEDLLHSPQPVPLAQWQSAVSLISRGQQVLAEASKHLDLATGPGIELAVALSSSKSTADLLKSQIAEHQRTALSLASQLTKTQNELRDLPEQVRNLQIEKNRLDRQLKQAMQVNPAGIYTVFTKGKPRK